MGLPTPLQGFPSLNDLQKLETQIPNYLNSRQQPQTQPTSTPAMLHTQPTSTYPKKISRPKLPQHPLAAPNLNVPQPRSSRRLCAITFLRTSGLHVNGTNFWGVALFRSGPGRPIVENRTRRTIEPSALYRVRATQKLAPFVSNHFFYELLGCT